MNGLNRLWSYAIITLVILGQVPVKAAFSSSSSSFNGCSNPSSSSSSSSSIDPESSSSISCSSSSSSDSCSSSSSSSEDCERRCGRSRTILVPRSQTLDAMNELALNNYFIYHNTPCPEDRPFLHAQLSYFHKQSNNVKHLRNYFLKDNRDDVKVRQNGSGNVGSLWIGIKNNDDFSSDFSICPKRKIDGGYFNFWADLNNWFCGTWAAISFAAYRSEAHTSFKESHIKHSGTGSIKNAQEAFDNPAWHYGRLSNKHVVRTGVDDVQFKLGWNYYFCNDDHAGLYLVAVAPTGSCHEHRNNHSSDNCKTSCKTESRHCNQYIWDPYVGSRHAGFGIGANTDWTLWECGSQAVNWMADFKYIYRFKAHEHRLFDLRRNGDYSRYLEVALPKAPETALPGVNFLNHKVEVTPRSLIEFWTALHWEWCTFNVEAGYNLFWRDSEKLCFKTDCKSKCGTEQNATTFGIYDLRDGKTSASNAKISESNKGSNVAPHDASFKTVNVKKDLDLRSGTQPTALTNTIYLGVSYNSEICCMPAMIGLTGSYEFASHHLDHDCRRFESSSSSDKCHKNRVRHDNRDKAAIEQWGVAVKGDLAF